MPWRIELGHQIREARLAKGLSQAALAAQTSVTREQISNIEHGKSAPAVNIVADIAAALDVEFLVRGIRIGKTLSTPAGAEKASETQMKLSFDQEHRFKAASVTISAMEQDSISLDLRLYREVA